MLIVVLLLVAIGAGYLFFTSRVSRQNSPVGSLWKEVGLAVKGRFADAEVVDLGSGQWRMYYSVEPEVPGNKLEMYSSVSSDGINWTKEEGVRKEFATFPDVVKLKDGRFRLYFQNMGVIKSAVSDDGLIWTDEPGIRIDKNETGFGLDTVGAQTTIQLSDGTYLMVYRGAEDEPYGNEKLPNKTTAYFFYATSADGVNFSKKGLALDSRNEVLKGFVDGAEWVKWDDEFRLYFWSYQGIYHLTYKDGKFSKDAIFDYTTSDDPSSQFPQNPPGDPTLASINGKWFMYYGQHEKGIYYATY